MATWFDQFPTDDRQYLGGSPTFDESAAGRGSEVPVMTPLDQASTAAQQSAQVLQQAQGAVGGGGAQTGASGDPGQAWQASGGRTVQDWLNFVQQWNSGHGPADQITVIGSAKGGGTYHGVNYDAVVASHEGGRGAQWLGPEAAGGGGGQGSLGAFGGLNFNSPYQTFTPPSLEDARNSPGYQFALQQGLQGVERGAAAHGTLLTGGTLKALEGYGAGLADQTYQNVFNRALQGNQTNFGNALQTSQYNTGNLFNLAALGKPA